MALEAWVARRGTSVGGAHLCVTNGPPNEGRSIIKQPSGSSGSTLTEQGGEDVVRGESDWSVSAQRSSVISFGAKSGVRDGDRGRSFL